MQNKQWKTKTGKTPKPSESHWFSLVFFCFFFAFAFYFLATSAFAICFVSFVLAFDSNVKPVRISLNRSKSRLAPDAMDCNAWNGMLYAWSQPHCHIMMFSVISIVNDFILEVPLIVNLYIFGILLLPWLALRERPKKQEKRRLLTGKLDTCEDRILAEQHIETIWNVTLFRSVWFFQCCEDPADPDSDSLTSSQAFAGLQLCSDSLIFVTHAYVRIVHSPPSSWDKCHVRPPQPSCLYQWIAHTQNQLVTSRTTSSVTIHPFKSWHFMKFHQP